MRCNINIRYEEKDKAKEFGAKWDWDDIYPPVFILFPGNASQVLCPVFRIYHAVLYLKPACLLFL